MAGSSTTRFIDAGFLTTPLWVDFIFIYLNSSHRIMVDNI